MSATLAAAAELSRGEAVTFWILGPVALAYVHRDYCESGTRLMLAAPSGGDASGMTATVADLPLIPPDSE